MFVISWFAGGGSNGEADPVKLSTWHIYGAINAMAPWERLEHLLSEADTEQVTRSWRR